MAVEQEVEAFDLCHISGDVNSVDDRKVLCGNESLSGTKHPLCNFRAHKNAVLWADQQIPVGDVKVPLADLVASLQQRVLVRSKIAQKVFGANEILVAAKHLCKVGGIAIDRDVEAMDDLHMRFDRHEVVGSNGVKIKPPYTP